MYYRIERTYLTRPDRSAERVIDTKPYLVPAASAHAAALVFITLDGAKLLGTVSEFPGDKAAATATRDARVFTIFVQRGAEAIASDLRKDSRL